MSAKRAHRTDAGRVSEHLRDLFLAAETIAQRGVPPFVAMVVRGDTVLANERNTVLPQLDPTAHAEMRAIRHACKLLSSLTLQGCAILTNAEPCLMCSGAIAWVRPDEVIYGVAREELRAYGFDDGADPVLGREALAGCGISARRISGDGARAAFEVWLASPARVTYAAESYSPKGDSSLPG